jgi:hypothetical protein
MTSRADKVTALALGLTLAHFADEPTLGDVRLLVHGRVHLWPEWNERPEVRAVVARFLACRPDELADDGVLLDRARDLLLAGADFQPEAGDEPRPGWGTRFRLVPGRTLGDRLDAWFAELEARRAAPNATRSKAHSGDEIVLAGDDLTYRVPKAHLPRGASPPPALSTAPFTGMLRLDGESLRSLARRIDGPRETAGLYERVGLGNFLDAFVTDGGAPVERLEAGTTKLALAPTGTGKSVFARLLALHLAGVGVPVALVVPDVRAVWKEVRALRAAATSAGLSPSIVPLTSWRGLADHLTNHVDHPPADDPDGRWALENAGYACLLGAYAEDGDPPTPGNEPCTRLTERDGRVRRRVPCPFAGDCGRFAAFRRAASADILVANHHSLLAGRVPGEISVDGGPPRKLSTAELVLRRCAVVLVDEIDALQIAAIGANSRSLALSSRGGLSKAYRLLTEVDRRRAEGRLDPQVSFERGRSALARITHEAERLSELVTRGELTWSSSGQFTWREAHDAWLASRLFGESEDGLDRVAALYDPDPVTDDARADALRCALRPLGPGLGDGTRISDVLGEIHATLATWPLLSVSRRPVQEERARIADRLIVRAALTQLDQALGHLRPQLPALEQQDVEQATQLRDDLLGYAPWQPSPTGALGRRLNGYAFSHRPGEQGVLEASILSGDPHGLVRELGGLVAQTLAGVPRIVLGLSATCRFRGSPRADVLGDVVGWVRDEARNVRVHGAEVDVRISGTTEQKKRLEAARTAAERLWHTSLSHFLDRLRGDTAREGRARALVVTGSYAEAEEVARGLRGVAGPALAIRYLVRRDADGSHPDALASTRLEAFGDVAGPAVLVGPLSVVARGHNILQPGTHLSALSGIFVLTRPVPPSHDADRFLAHLSYNARLMPPTWRGAPGPTLEAERADARRRLRALQRTPAAFRHMAPALRQELVCDVLVELAQVAGRARRGGTDVDLFFVDGAFQDEIAPWSRLVSGVLAWWADHGVLDEMVTLHGAFVTGLADYAGFSLPAAPRSTSR